jgi:aminopeptidase N
VASIAVLGAIGAIGAQGAVAATGLGDPFFPEQGNGGYDVRAYELRLQFHPDRDLLQATATIQATATDELRSFSLDFRHLRTLGVRVDGRLAARTRSGQKLIVVAPAPIAIGQRFTVAVRYRGHPRPINDRDGSKEGWFNTDDGSLVAAEPRGAPSWFPVNDALTDKATFEFKLTVPRSLKAIANGRLVERARRGRRSVWHWSVTEPMAPYLATVATGRFRLRRSTEAGIEALTAVDPRLWARSRAPLRRTGRILALFESLFGPYPFEVTGAIVDDASMIGYALETQTRPVYDRVPRSTLIAHELAHQWFGDSVGLTTWPEIWLNEGFATWAQWRWAEQAGGPTTAERLSRLSATPASANEFWNPPPAALPGPGKLFSDSVYVRGAMALEVLRQQVGERTFVAILREWTSAHAFGNATIAEFVALAEARSGQELSLLFDAWLYRPGKPA